MLLTEFKPQGSLSLVNGSEEDKKMTDLFKCGISLVNGSEEDKKMTDLFKCGISSKPGLLHRRRGS